jgi:TPR repeat protein
MKLAADQGIPEAQEDYGRCLQKGAGVSADFRAAASYLKLAADNGFVESYIDSLLCGRLLDADQTEIGALLKLHADQGFAYPCVPSDHPGSDR